MSANIAEFRSNVKLKRCPFCGRKPDVYQAPNMVILMGMPYFPGDWICLCLHCQQAAVGAKKI